MKNILLTLLIVTSLSAVAQGPNYPYSVPNTWNASKDAVVSYNLYRAIQTGATCGAWIKINTSPITGLNFTDGTVADETTYCYAATSVDAKGRESGLSNIVQGMDIGPAPPTGFNAQVAKVGKQSNVTFAYAQSKDPGVKFNDIYVSKKIGGPYTVAHLQFPAAPKYVYKNAPKGTFFAVVTATAKTESGKSIETKIIVQ